MLRWKIYLRRTVGNMNILKNVFVQGNMQKKRGCGRQRDI